MTQFHIINNWLWLGAVPSLDEAATTVRTLRALIRMAIKFSVSH